ncbi:MAG: DNA replication protein DnaC [Firmicutes bacterium]|nr:DNA replication protein DnaC [Bacillota bacterium]
MYKKTVNEILKEFEKKRDHAKFQQEQRQREVYNKVPEIEKLDNEISKTGILLSRAILNNPENYNEKLNEIKEKMEQLRRKKAILMTENNIPLEYLDTNYDCNKCNDTGFLSNGRKCNCLKQALINSSYEMSNLSNVLKKENFSTFNINIFPTDKFEEEDLSPRENMLNILNICEGFVINFHEDNEENLLFYGNTGLGKTFMCNCIAKSLLDKGRIVIYQTAFKMLEVIRNHRFNNGFNKVNNSQEYNMLFESDLLIIDDLGTENTTGFTNTEIFNIVNSRLIKGNKTIISTNLSPKEFADTYTDRTVSRIFNKFKPLKFYGPDLRWET